HKTRLGDECEFEGLAADNAAGRLLLLCKNIRKKANIDTLSIFAWDAARRALLPDGRIELPIRDISLALRTRHLHPSGLVIHPGTGNLLLVAAREQALIELDGDGKFVTARRLSLAMRHPQAEGIEFTPDGRLILADEGGKSRARLSLYDAH
ncbi:MAG: SdiA-regulated domain-containing protein, partial [Pseudomonadota bacterium]